MPNFKNIGHCDVQQKCGDLLRCSATKSYLTFLFSNQNVVTFFCSQPKFRDLYVQQKSVVTFAFSNQSSVTYVQQLKCCDISFSNPYVPRLVHQLKCHDPLFVMFIFLFFLHINFTCQLFFFPSFFSSPILLAPFFLLTNPAPAVPAAHNPRVRGRAVQN